MERLTISQLVAHENAARWGALGLRLVKDGGRANSSSPRPALALLSLEDGTERVITRWAGSSWEAVLKSYILDSATLYNIYQARDYLAR